MFNLFRNAKTLAVARHETLIVETKQNDETLLITRYVATACAMSRSVYVVRIFDANNDLCLERELDTLADAFKVHYMYLMHTFADSQYAIDDDNAHAYASFR
ncbi:hypothetical protein B9J07_27725 [Sinorhizobium sp. LM21]|nr:hypothetical protein B9J07_27725 [Sinorhizobium sp. LM21]